MLLSPIFVYTGFPDYLLLLSTVVLPMIFLNLYGHASVNCRWLMSLVFPLALVCHQLVIPSCLRYPHQMFFYPLRNSSALSFCIKFVFLPYSNLCLVVWSLLLNSVYLSTCFIQTYGSGNLKRVGVFLQRGILILLLACFPCWAVLINTEPILLAVRQSPEVARSVPVMK